MSKLSPRPRPPLEVTIMFEPHRLQHDLLREAYAHLTPKSRRRLSSGKRPLGVRRVQSPKGEERQIA